MNHITRALLKEFTKWMLANGYAIVRRPDGPSPQDQSNSYRLVDDYCDNYRYGDPHWAEVE